MPDQFEALLERHRHLLDDPVAHGAAVREANIRAERMGKVSVPDGILHLGESVSLARFQTPIRNQEGRGTCYAFAACAALESAYKREYGLELNLSEQYTFHVGKAFELDPSYITSASPVENNTSMTGFQGSSDMVDRMARFAVPDEAVAPYLLAAGMTALQASIPAAGMLGNQEQYDALEFAEGHVPTAARHAARYRVSDYRALPDNPSVDDVCAVIRSGREVVADVTDHCFLIIGFDDNRRQFLVKNSWGGTEYFDYSYDSPVLGGRYIVAIHPPTAAPQKRAMWVGRWHMDHDGWVGELVIRRFTNFRATDEVATKLGSYYRDGKRYDVNGRTRNDGGTLEFWIADTTAKVTPGAQSGQRFEIHLFESDPTTAAGTTKWNGIDFGVRLTRASTGHNPIAGFDRSRWIDSWEVRHDGHRARLDISSVQPLEAIYEPPGGARLSVTGGLSPTDPHILAIRVPFDDVDRQHFALYHHTREAGVFSGVTSFGARHAGVIGDRVVPQAIHPFARDPTVIPAWVYLREPGGVLRWYRHDGAQTGGDAWKGPAYVGRGWHGFTHVFPGGGNVIYAIDAGGELRWYEHRGFNTGLGVGSPDAWAGGHAVGRGWNGFARVFSGGDGVIYAITTDGRLLWYRHHGVATGVGLETPGAWSGAKEVGHGWESMVHVFSTGEGIIYGVRPDGDLWWYKHVGWVDGRGLETPGAWEGRHSVGRGWAEFTSIFSRGDGIIYGIQPDGTLLWYRHDGYRTGAGLETPGAWRGRTPVGTGWNGFTSAFALLPRAPDGVR